MSKSPKTLAFKAPLVVEGPASFIELPCDPREVFGKLRAPVKVTLNGYSYRSTIAAMGGPPCIGVRASHRTAAGLKGGDLIDVRLELDEEKREVTPPADLVKALKAVPGAWDRWRALSFTTSASTPRRSRRRRSPKRAPAVSPTPSRWSGRRRRSRRGRL